MVAKILIVTIKFPFPTIGACESDRINGILRFKNLGFDIKVITKNTRYQPIEKVQEISKNLGIEMTPVSYKFDTKASKIKKLKEYILRFFKNPLILDGAASEFDDPELKDLLETKIKDWQPDIVWFDSTYTWPLYAIAKKYKTPVIARSMNFEPIHFLEENGYNLINYIRFIPKFIGELMAVRKSDLLFTITPREAKTYKKLGAKNVEILPLRGLPKCLKRKRDIKNKQKLNVFYMGSGYSVFHMKAALEFIFKKIVPRIDKIAPNKFSFHVFGAKFPKEYESYLKNNVVYRGYVENLEQALESMDIALIPSLCGAGMQQKIFEPLARGIPTITSPRGIAGYSFENEKNVLLASDADEFVKHLIKLQDIHLRKNLSEQALKTSNQLFSQDKLDSIVLSNINKLIYASQTH
ncbi:MAG: glycosyltransferase [Candidatus Nealsonbacteria bacterium]